MVRRSWMFVTLALCGCSDLAGRTPIRDGGAELSDSVAEPIDAVSEPSDAVADTSGGTLRDVRSLPQDVPQIPGCAAPSTLASGAEISERSVTFTSPLIANFHVKSAVLDARGRAVVIGTTTACNAAGNFDAVALRFGSDGALDTTFGDGGRFCLNTVVSGENLQDTLLGAALDAEQRLVLVGFSESVRTLAIRGLLARVTPDGELDTDFAAVGWRHVGVAPTITQSTNMAFWNVLIDGSRILAVGTDASPFRLPSIGFVAAFDADGELDHSFARDGIFFDVARHYHGIARRSDGYVISATERSVARVSLRALDRDGSPIRDFGDDSVAVSALPQEAYAGDLLVDDDGGVLVVRATPVSTSGSLDASASVIRFLPDGRPDMEFGDRGVFDSGDRWTYSYSHGHHLARHCDGRVLFAAQSSGSSLRVSRIDARGRLDRSFGSGGVANLRGSSRTDILVGIVGIAVDADTGNVMLAGSSSGNDTIFVRAAAR